MTALHVLGGLTLEDGRRWGEAAADFQRDDAAAILDPSPSAVRLHYLTRPRGASKTSDLAGVVLALLLEVFGPDDAGHVFACDSDQASELLRAASGFVSRTSELRGLVDVQSRRIVTPSGASFAVVPADSGSAFGLRSRAIVFDEFTMLGSTPEHRRLWDAAFSTQPKLDALLVLLGTAGDPASWQANVLAQAKTSKRWRVHEVPGPVPWIAAAALEEQARILLPSQYQRLHLNQWVAPEDRLTTVDDVRACVDHEGVLAPRPRVSYKIGVDLGVKRDATVIVVADSEGRGDDRCVIVDRVEVFAPRPGRPVDLKVVEEAIRHVSRSYNRARVIADPWQALLMIGQLRSTGVSIDEFPFTQQSIGRIALTLYGLLRDRRIGLPDDEALLDELANVRLRESSPGVFRLDHDANRHDDRAIALALCAHALADRGPIGPVTTSSQAARHKRFASGIGEARPIASASQRLAGGSQQEKYLRARGNQPSRATTQRKVVLTMVSGFRDSYSIDGGEFDDDECAQYPDACALFSIVFSHLRRPVVCAHLWNAAPLGPLEMFQCRALPVARSLSRLLARPCRDRASRRSRVRDPCLHPPDRRRRTVRSRVRVRDHSRHRRDRRTTCDRHGRRGRHSLP